VAGFLALYHLNGGFLVGLDAAPNVFLPVNLLSGGGLAFTPERMPRMFTWELQGRQGPRIVRFESWEQRTSSGATCRALYEQGKLTMHRPDYYLVPSVDPETRGYVNQYGEGAGLTALPVFAVESLVLGDLTDHKAAVWYGGKFCAALCVAVSVAVVFLSLARLTGRWEALAIATAYGAGTCVWSVSSLTLWQSGPNVMFLALAAYCLLRIEGRRQGEDATPPATALTPALSQRPSSKDFLISSRGPLTPDPSPARGEGSDRRAPYHAR
jgi:hypothetical protein